MNGQDNISLKGYIFADLKRICDPSVKQFLHYYFFPKGYMFRHDVWFRILQFSKKKIILKYTLGIYAAFRECRLAHKYGIHANSNTPVGPGLKIVHGDGVYINCSSVGSNFTIYQGVTCGNNGKDDLLPIIEDNVTIYAGAVVVGGITLHSGCTIGANSFVNRDVDYGSVVVGVPAVTTHHERDKGT